MDIFEITEYLSGNKVRYKVRAYYDKGKKVWMHEFEKANKIPHNDVINIAKEVFKHSRKKLS